MYYKLTFYDTNHYERVYSPDETSPSPWVMSFATKAELLEYLTKYPRPKFYPKVYLVPDPVDITAAFFEDSDNAGS